MMTLLASPGADIVDRSWSPARFCNCPPAARPVSMGVGHALSRMSRRGLRRRSLLALPQLSLSSPHLLRGPIVPQARKLEQIAPW